MDEHSAAKLLDDPNLPGETLASIAQHFPSLRSQVAAHPSVYPDLVAWINAQQVDETGQPALKPAAISEPSLQTSDQQRQREAAPENAEQNQRRGLAKPIAVAVGAMVTVLAVVGGIWWLSQSRGGESGDLGTERAIEAGLKRAAKLSGDSEEIANHQLVYGPSLFAYSDTEEAREAAASGALYAHDQIVLNLSDGADFQTVEKASEQVRGTIVGVNEHSNSYQLYLADVGDSADLGDSIAVLKAMEGVEDATANFGLLVQSPSSESRSDKTDSGGVEPSPVVLRYEDEVGLAEITVGVLDASNTEVGTAEEVEGLAPNAKVVAPEGSGMSEGESVDVFSLANSLTYLIERSDQPVVIAAPSFVGFVEAELEEAAKTLGEQLVTLMEGGAPGFLFVAPQPQGCNETAGEEAEDCAETATHDVWQLLGDMYPAELEGKVLRARGEAEPLSLSAEAAVVWGVNPSLSGEQVVEILRGAGGNFDLPAAMQLAVATKGLEGEDATARIKDLQAVDISVDLQGTWCSADQLGTKAKGCLNFLDLLGPNATFETVEAGEEGQPTTLLVCLSGECEDGEELTFAYYPPGTPWECVEDADAPGCEGASVEEMTSADPGENAPHDTSWPRLVQRYMDGDEAAQGTPLLLNLQAEGDHPDLPEVILEDVNPWPMGGAGGWQPEYQMTSFRADWSEPTTVLVAKKGEPGVQLYLEDLDRSGRVEGPYPALEDAGDIVWLTEGAAVNAEGDAFAWETDMSSTFFSGTVQSPVSVNEWLDLDKPVAQVEFLSCYLCQIDADDPIPKAVAILYQDGTAELFSDTGDRQPVGPPGHIDRMTASVEAALTFVMSDGEVYASFFGEPSKQRDFGGADIVYACDSGGDTFALTGSGELLATQDFGQKAARPLNLPDGQSVSQIDCTPFTTSSSRHPVFEPRIFVLTTEGEVLQYARPFMGDGPKWNSLAGPGMSAVDDYMILSEDGRVLFTETLGYEGFAEVVQ